MKVDEWRDSLDTKNLFGIMMLPMIDLNMKKSEGAWMNKEKIFQYFFDLCCQDYHLRDDLSHRHFSYRNILNLASKNKAAS